MCVSTLPSYLISNGQQWLNPEDGLTYAADIRKKMWICGRRTILMPKGTVYREENSGNEYVLGNHKWKICKVGDIRGECRKYLSVIRRSFSYYISSDDEKEDERSL